MEYEKTIDVDMFEEVNIIVLDKSRIVGLNIETIYGRATTALEINDAKRLRNYLTEAINFATLNIQEEEEK